MRFRKNFVFIYCFAYEKLYCIFDSLLPSFNRLRPATTENRDEKCSAIPMDTSLVVVDSTILLYSNLKTSDKEIHAILKERPEYPGGMDEVVKYIQTHIQYPPTAVYKK